VELIAMSVSIEDRTDCHMEAILNASILPRPEREAAIRASWDVNKNVNLLTKAFSIEQSIVEPLKTSTSLVT